MAAARRVRCAVKPARWPTRFDLTAALLFAASAAVTIAWCRSMQAAPVMRMPGGWAMSMAWMRMPGQSWVAAGASFLGMWAVMMVAMMMPSLVPMLRAYRSGLAPAEARRAGRLTVVVALGYHAVWTAVGLAAFLAGVGLAAVEMRHPSASRGVPFAVGAVVLGAGLTQLTAWKARALDCCREPPRGYPASPAGVASAWRHGVQLGVRCSLCCAGLTVILLVVGVMDLGAMTAVAAATTLERLAPAGHRVARTTGALVIAAALVLIARAALIATG